MGTVSKLKNVLVVAALGASLMPVYEVPVGAAGPGEYSAPDWLPLRGANAVNCTYNNDCLNGYHGYQAIDFVTTENENI